MKLIQCIVRPGKLEDLVRALSPVISGMTAREIRTAGAEGAWHAIYRGVEYQALTPRVLIDIVTDESWVDDIIRIVAETAKTGESGDGFIHIMPVEGSYHVRTGFMDV